MRFNDAVFGVVLLLSAAVMIYHTRDFPEMPGQDYGPALFPVLIGCGMIVCGVVLLVSGIKRVDREPLASWDDWISSPRHLGNLFAVLGGLLAYILVVDKLGFIPTAFLLLSGLFIQLRGGRIVSSMAIAVVVTVAVHFMFTRYLLVPLPWGVLTPIAW